MVIKFNFALKIKKKKITSQKMNEIYLIYIRLKSIIISALNPNSQILHF